MWQMEMRLDESGVEGRRVRLPSLRHEDGQRVGVAVRFEIVANQLVDDQVVVRQFRLRNRLRDAVRRR